LEIHIEKSLLKCPNPGKKLCRYGGDALTFSKTRENKKVVGKQKMRLDQQTAEETNFRMIRSNSATRGIIA